MNKNVVEQINLIEKENGIQFPNLYKKFLVEEIQDNDVYEIVDKNQSCIYLYGYAVLLERNKTYQIQDIEPNYFLIGQDGDLGYFVYIKKQIESEIVYSLDLGALGSLNMQKVANSIYELS